MACNSKKHHPHAGIFVERINTMKVKTVRFLAVPLLVMCLGSCKKLEVSLFGGQTIVLPAYALTVPAIPFADSTLEFNTGSFTTYINTDSIIRAQTSGKYDINDVSSVKVTKVALSISNADANNNLSAFKSMLITISSSANANAADMFSINIPAYADSVYTTGPSNTANIIGYLYGTTINNTVYGYVRKTTSKPLYLQAVITMYSK
jgi:hypothetical protein